MNTFVEIFYGVPIVLFVAVIFGVAALIRLYVLNVPSIRRLSRQDRRQTLQDGAFPVRDCNNILISEERRKLVNRRLASNVAIKGDIKLELKSRLLS